MKKQALIYLFLLYFGVTDFKAQDFSVPKEKDSYHTSGLWTGVYTKYRISERFLYYGEYHYRRRNNFINDMAQIYLRFGTTYLVNPKFEITAGIVTPVYWAPDQEAPNIDKRVMQYRLWEQFLFVQSLDRAKIYHQLRFEQRWKRNYEKNSPFKLTYRFRYKISSYIPLNSDYLRPKTLFLSLYEEIFIQAGKSVIYDHMEDNRIFIGLGYILNSNIQLQAGYMYTYRHGGSPYLYEQRHIPRISLYHNLDFYKLKKERRKEVPILQHEF